LPKLTRRRDRKLAALRAHKDKSAEV